MRRPTPRLKAQPGKADNPVHPFKIESGDKVIIFCHVSMGLQEDKMSLDDQGRFLRREVERRGGVVLGVVVEVTCGQDPIRLNKAVTLAKRKKAKILAESMDHFIGHPSCRGKTESDPQAKHSGLDSLSQAAEDVEFMTFLDPGATPGELRRSQGRRGPRLKGQVGARPKEQRAGYKKERRQKLLPYVVELSENGKSQRQIARVTGVAQSTVQEWLSKYCW
jgi:hypothetical protein